MSARRVGAAAMAALLAVADGCSPYRAIPLTRLEIPAEVQPRPGEVRPRIRFRLDGSEAWYAMQVRVIEAPYLRGVLTEGEPPVATTRRVSVDVRRIGELQLYSDEAARWQSVGTAVGATLGVIAGVGLVVLVVALASKSSCPFVFVETPEGVRFVGEAYSGSVVRALQRDDLLELPALGPGPVRLALGNHANETQHTDRLELVLVDHGPDERAVAGLDARPLLVGASRPPVRVTGLDGRALPTPTSAPGGAWESAMDVLARRDDAPLRDGIEVTFPAVAEGATPVLELDAANTHWLDLVLGRMFASFGDGLREHLARSDARPDDATPRAWREREAIDLSVETLVAGQWRRAARVTTPGPAALRHVAVTLPRPPAGEALRVRLVAGTGFWRIGALGVSTLRDPAPSATRVAPTRAAQPDGSDARALLAAVDGAYQHLPRRGDRLELTFEAPAASAGRSRTAFLFANGYYTVHAQPQAERSSGTLLRLRDEPGAMARFGLDLYRELTRVVREAPALPP